MVSCRPVFTRCRMTTFHNVRPSRYDPSAKNAFSSILRLCHSTAFLLLLANHVHASRTSGTRNSGRLAFTSVDTSGERRAHVMVVRPDSITDGPTQADTFCPSQSL